MTTVPTHDTSRDDTPAHGSAHLHAPEWLRESVEQLEGDDRLDAAADALDGFGRPLAEGPAGGALRGEWLGHALHPLLTDLPLGCWQASALLDLLGGRASRPASRRLVGLGVLAAVPTAATGLVELASTDDPRIRRVGAVHAAGNTVALALYAGSYRARRRDHHLRGAALGLTAGALAVATGYLGGHMSFVRGAGQGERGLHDAGHESDGEVTRPSNPEEVRGAGRTDLLDVEQAARDLTMPVEQVHTLVEQGLLTAVTTEPLRFRTADVEAVRLMGG